MIGKISNLRLVVSEKKGSNAREETPMLRHRSCPSCQHSRMLPFENASRDTTCPSCRHVEDMPPMRREARGGADGMEALALILVAILVSLVFALFVFSVASASTIQRSGHFSSGQDDSLRAAFTLMKHPHF
jgi:uncharacterized paraquat-inducible protein A